VITDFGAPGRRLAPALVSFVAVAGLAAENGGYFPTAWGWAALAFLLLSGSALLIRDRTAMGRLDLVLVAALAAYAVWVGLSALWSANAAEPLLELERALLYAVAALALLLVTDRREAASLLVGACSGVVAISLYALATRLLPGWLGDYPPADGYQLAQPVGYWNGLGILVGIGALLAVGLAAWGGSRRLRASAAASLPALAATLYFTFSRGSWVALAVGLVALVLLSGRRAPALLALGLALSPAPAVAVLVCSRSKPLTEAGAPLADAARDGHRVAVALVVLMLIEAGVVVAWERAQRVVRVGRRGRLAVAAALIATGVLVASALVARVGSPVRMAERGYDSFTAPLPATGGDLNRRLFSVSGNGRSDYWRVAWKQVEADPVLGGGAGGFERAWLQERPTAFFARDAHNLYLETLAELGPVGLVLLAAALAVPLLALARARRETLAAAAGAAYVAFLAHAAVDWDWELPAVTVAALCCGAALVAWARPEHGGRALANRARAAAIVPLVAVTAFVFVMHAGNTALARSESALERGDVEGAESAARAARRWLPWSFEPWERLAEAQLAAGDAGTARASVREAIERDPGNWSLWYALAAASDGKAREAALGRAAELNPLGPELAEPPPGF
jgi:O-Antigen ligase